MEGGRSERVGSGAELRLAEGEGGHPTSQRAAVRGGLLLLFVVSSAACHSAELCELWGVTLATRPPQLTHAR